jgi:hypothetical protein
MPATQPGTAPTKSRASRAGALVLAAASGLGIAFVVTLTVMCGLHQLNFDSRGYPLVNDFVSFWSAGRLVLQGHPLAAYDPHLRHAAEIATVGHPFKDEIGWWYPPLFLFVAAALAYLPYAAAFNALNGVTLLLHAGVTAMIARRREAFFLAAATPWAMFGMMRGQSQFLTASIIGAALLTVERRPALSGIVLGLLSYKPQLGLLFPIALAFGGYWRAFGWACAGTALWTALSGAVFGFNTFLPFIHGLSTVGREVLVTDPSYLPCLQSLYGLARSLGFSDGSAWGMQACISAACVIAIAGLWRSKAAFELKAAGLATAIPLVTPYVWPYDLATLTVALPFLYRHRPFDGKEWAAVAISIFSFGTFWWQTAHPAGLIACAAVGAVVWRRSLDPGRIAVRARDEADSAACKLPVGASADFGPISATSLSSS